MWYQLPRRLRQEHHQYPAVPTQIILDYTLQDPVSEVNKGHEMCMGATPTSGNFIERKLEAG